MFKNNYCTENYLQNIISLKNRSAFAKFRCGVAPLKLETGRYEKKEVHERTCFNCSSIVEDEIHVILKCPLYVDLRQIMIHEALHFNEHFNLLSDNEKFIFLFSNGNVAAIVAKTCNNILLRRNSILFH